MKKFHISIFVALFSHVLCNRDSFLESGKQDVLRLITENGSGKDLLANIEQELEILIGSDGAR